jgi:hypothetical protein
LSLDAKTKTMLPKEYYGGKVSESQSNWGGGF